MRESIKRILIIGVSAGAIGLTGCGKPPAETSATKPSESSEKNPEAALLRLTAEQLKSVKITTTDAQSRKSVEVVSATGEVTTAPDGFAEIVPPMAGRVITLLVSQGDDVRRGQALAIVESAEIGRTRSELSAAQSRLSLAKASLARKQALLASGVAAPREVQEATADVAAADAAISSAESIKRYFFNPLPRGKNCRKLKLLQPGHMALGTCK